jgi:hypothetical protein
MPFNLTSARVHPLHGLEVTDDTGQSFGCGERISRAREEGLVFFKGLAAEESPYIINFCNDPMAGTDDPRVVALVIKWGEGAFDGGGNDWCEIPFE